MALAVLTKGPIGLILPAGAIGFYILISRKFSLIRELKPVQGMILFLLVALPWYLFVCTRNPDFFSFFFINQNIRRYAASNEHNQPFYYFFLVILAGALPWTLLLPSALRKIRNKQVPDELLFMMIWFSLIFLFFLPSHSQLATYVLPCFPPLALLIAYSLKDSTFGSLHIYVAGSALACLGITLMVLPVLAAHGFMHPFPLSLLEDIDLLQDLPPSARLFAYDEYPQSSSFYAQRKVGLVRCEGELAYGIRHDTSKDTVYSLNDLVALVNRGENIYCLIKLHDFSSLHRMIPELSVVRQAHKFCLVNARGRSTALSWCKKSRLFISSGSDHTCRSNKKWH